MSPLQQNLDTVGTETTSHAADVSEMRRVSMGLAFSPARHRRRRLMETAGRLRGLSGLARRRATATR